MEEGVGSGEATETHIKSSRFPSPKPKDKPRLSIPGTVTAPKQDTHPKGPHTPHIQRLTGRNAHVACQHNPISGRSKATLRDKKKARDSAMKKTHTPSSPPFSPIRELSFLPSSRRSFQVDIITQSTATIRGVCSRVHTQRNKQQHIKA